MEKIKIGTVGYKLLDMIIFAGIVGFFVFKILEKHVPPELIP